MATAYAIKDWEGSFTTSELDRKVKVWRYVPIPIKLAGENFRTLMSSKFGRQNFALFVALCECCANLPKRGLLADERGPLSAKSISIRTGIPEVAVKQGISALSHPDIGWLVRVVVGELSGHHPDVVRTNPTLPDHTLPDHTLPSGRGRENRYLWAEVEPIVSAYPAHRMIGKGPAVQAIQRAMSETVLPPGAEPLPWLLGRVRAYAASWAATREGGKYALGFKKWLEDGIFEQPDKCWAEPPDQNGHVKHDYSAMAERAVKKAQEATR